MPVTRCTVPSEQGGRSAPGITRGLRARKTGLVGAEATRTEEGGDYSVIGRAGNNLLRRLFSFYSYCSD